MTDKRHPPNRILTWERLQRGWSYEELAKRVREEMARCGESDTGLTANTVRRWETGDRWPEPRFRKHLVTIFGKQATDLGLLTAEELALCPARDVMYEIRRLMAVAEEHMNPNGVDRATFLRGLLGIGTLPLVSGLIGRFDYEQLAAETARGAPADLGTARAYTRVVAGQRELYWSSPPGDLFESAYAHVQLGIRLLRSASDTKARVSLSAALAESAMLAGRLAFFDLRQAAVAQRCYDVAFSATREAGDHALAAGVLGHMAFIPAFAGETAQGLQLVDAAQQHCWHGVPAITRSWLHCVGAETIAKSADPSRYQHRIELAQASLGSDEQMPEWFDFYDESRLNGFAGYSALAAGDTTAAAASLGRSLADLDPGAIKQRTVLLADLASAHIGEPALAAAYVDRAIDALADGWYATGHQRIAEVVGHLPAGADRERVLERSRELTPVALPGAW